MIGSRWRLALVVAVAVLVFLYRFNTLSGELGGFDNDHFINIARGAQLLQGDWPVRDYPDASLQGAWPPLTYLASAGAQVVFGRSLLAEACLSAGAIALGAALTLLAAVNLTGSVLLGVAAAWISVLPSVKLYGYARPLVFGACMLLVFRGIDRRTAGRLAAVAAMLAVAFLVRHDYAVYLAFGWIGASAIRALHDRRALVELLATGTLAIALITPSILIVQREVGVGAYVATARAAAQDEFNRTNLRWPTLDLTSPLAAGNATAWAYFVVLALPWLALVVALLRARRAGGAGTELAKIGAVAVAALIANRFLLRGNVEARLADVAVFAVLLAVWLLKAMFDHCSVLALPWIPRWGWRGLRLLTLVVLFVSVAALRVVGAVSTEVATGKLREGPVAALQRAALVWGRLAEEPPLQWGPADGLDGPMKAAAYLHACTAPSDRVMVTTTSPEIGVYARRGFAAGHADWVVGFYNTPAEQQTAVERASRQSIPIVLTEPAVDHQRVFATEFPIVEAYLRAHYRGAGEIARGGRPYLRVMVRNDRTPLGTFDHTDWPCFQ